jgi:hypothetical protein
VVGHPRGCAACLGAAAALKERRTAVIIRTSERGTWRPTGNVALIDENGRVSLSRTTSSGSSSVSDSCACSGCCRHAKEVHDDLTKAIGMAAKLASLLLLIDTDSALTRAPLHVVGQAPAPEEPVRLADVIQFPTRRPARGARPNARQASG